MTNLIAKENFNSVKIENNEVTFKLTQTEFMILKELLNSLDVDSVCEKLCGYLNYPFICEKNNPEDFLNGKIPKCKLRIVMEHLLIKVNE